MNIRSLCFARVSRDRGEPWLWWEFVDKLGADCGMKDKVYTPECAQKVRAVWAVMGAFCPPSPVYLVETLVKRSGGCGLSSPHVSAFNRAASQPAPAPTLPQVFDAVAAGSAAVGSKEGRKAWSSCIDVGSPDSRDPIPMLDDELKAQTGAEGEGTVAILPTVRINKRQYRGTLDAGSVQRALCAAFPTGSEPPVCTETWVSEDECAEGGDGWRACSSG